MTSGGNENKKTPLEEMLYILDEKWEEERPEKINAKDSYDKLSGVTDGENKTSEEKQEDTKDNGDDDSDDDSSEDGEKEDKKEDKKESDNTEKKSENSDEPAAAGNDNDSIKELFEKADDEEADKMLLDHVTDYVTKNEIPCVQLYMEKRFAGDSALMKKKMNDRLNHLYMIRKMRKFQKPRATTVRWQPASIKFRRQFDNVGLVSERESKSYSMLNNKK